MYARLAGRGRGEQGADGNHARGEQTGSRQGADREQTGSRQGAEGADTEVAAHIDADNSSPSS